MLRFIDGHDGADRNGYLPAVSLEIDDVLYCVQPVLDQELKAAAKQTGLSEGQWDDLTPEVKLASLNELSAWSNDPWPLDLVESTDGEG